MSPEECASDTEKAFFKTPAMAGGCTSAFQSRCVLLQEDRITFEQALLLQ